MKSKTFRIEYDENKTKELTADIVETSMNYANRYLKYRVSEVKEEWCECEWTPPIEPESPVRITCPSCHKPIKPKSQVPEDIEHPELYKAIKYVVEHSKEVQEFIRRQEKELEERE